MFALDLAKIQFSPITTDEEKIIFAFTRGFTIRKIKEAFHFGTSKVSETIKYYKRTGNVPKSQQREPPKLTSEVLASFIEGLISIISDESGIELPPSPIKDSPFTNEEDQNILQCYIKFNGQWNKISRLIKGRTPEQIKNRYNTVIKKRVAHGKFTFNS